MFQLEKDPEDYSEADLKAIKEYEEKCKFLASERERYRKMLEIEYKKLENTIQVNFFWLKLGKVTSQEGHLKVE